MKEALARHAPRRHHDEPRPPDSESTRPQASSPRHRPRAWRRLASLLLLLVLIVPSIACSHPEPTTDLERQRLLRNALILGLCGAALLIGLIVHRYREVLRVNRIIQQTNQDLQQALAETRVLRELIPICAGCRKARDDDGYWHRLEEYISAHSDTRFSHGLCPDCARELYGDIMENGADDHGGPPGD